MRKAVWARLVLGLLLGALVGEGAIRFYFYVDPSPPVDGFIPDSEAGYRMRPEPNFPDGHDGHINAHGFFGREYSDEKPAEIYRVLGVGDSFVYGSVPIEENFLRLAEGASQSSVQVCLLGAAGYSPRNYVGLLKSELENLDPDLVILCFFVGNDVSGIPVIGEVLGGRLYFRGSSSRVHRWLRKSDLFLVSERVILSAFKNAFRAESGQRPAESVLSPQQPEGGRSLSQVQKPDQEVDSNSDPTPPYLLFQSRRLALYERKTSSSIDRLWHEATGYLQEIDSVCRGAGVPWVLFLVPSEMQVDFAVRGLVLDRLSRQSSEFDFDQPQRRLSGIAKDLGVRLIDPLRQFREAQEERGRLYFPNDTHWNAEGNRLAGEILAEEIQRQVRPSRD